MLREFRDFIVTSSALDLAIGVVIGAAFGQFVDVLVNDVLMQFVAALVGSPDFGAIALPLGQAEIEIGLLVNALINLLLIALAVFVVIKGVNALRRRTSGSRSDADPQDIVLLREIRDALREDGASPRS
ncbi:MAG: large conductance mechanosensitive channel protein MscL [Gaiellales bacterium]